MVGLPIIALAATLAPSVSARAINLDSILFSRQSSLACGASDLTPAAWIANNIDDFIAQASNDNKLAVHGNAFGNALVESATQCGCNTDCTDLANIDRCAIDAPSGSTVCDQLSDPQLGFLVQSYVNIYNNLRNMFFAVRRASEALTNEGFANKLVTDISPKPLPIPRSTLLEIVDLTLDFLPLPELGEGASVAVKELEDILDHLTEIAGKGVDLASDSAEAQEDSIKNQPKLLQDMIDNVIPLVQNAITNQLNAIFVQEHDDDFHANLLRGGVHLGKVWSEDEYTDSMTRNLRVYLTSVAMNGISMQLIIDDLSSCEFPDIRAPNGVDCHRLVVPEGGVAVTSVSSDKSNDLGDMQNIAGISLSDIMDNALDCDVSGQSFQNADFAGFVEGSSGGPVPKCMFGLKVLRQHFT